MMKLMTAARQSPNFGLRLLAELPPEARAEAVRRWSLEVSGEGAAPLRPGLKKCGTAPAPLKSELSAQLTAFSRSVGRVR